MSTLLDRLGASKSSGILTVSASFNPTVQGVAVLLVDPHEEVLVHVGLLQLFVEQLVRVALPGRNVGLHELGHLLLLALLRVLGHQPLLGLEVAAVVLVGAVYLHVPQNRHGQLLVDQSFLFYRLAVQGAELVVLEPAFDAPVAEEVAAGQELGLEQHVAADRAEERGRDAGRVNIARLFHPIIVDSRITFGGEDSNFPGPKNRKPKTPSICPEKTSDFPRR